MRKGDGMFLRKGFTPLEIKKHNGRRLKNGEVAQGGMFMYRKKKFLAGFTIIELLIVITVIAILVGIALPRFKGMQDEANIAKARGDLRTLQTAVESYYIHNANTYPATLGVLTSAIPNIIGTTLPKNPFSTATDAPYTYTVVGGIYTISSAGPTGGTAITVTNQ